MPGMSGTGSSPPRSQGLAAGAGAGLVPLLGTPPNAAIKSLPLLLAGEKGSAARQDILE